MFKELIFKINSMTPPHPFLQTHLSLLHHDDSTTSLPPNTSFPPLSRWLHHIPSSKHIFPSFITMTPPHPFLQTHLSLLYHDDSTTSLPPNTSFPPLSRWLHHIPSSKHIVPSFITMTPPYPFLQTHLCLLDHDDFTISLPPNTSFPSWSRWLHHIPSSKHIFPCFITMTLPHPFLQTHLSLLDHDDFTTSLPPNTSFPPLSRWLHHIPSSKHIFPFLITMTSPHPFLQTHLSLLYHDDSTTSLPPNTSFPPLSRWLHHIPSSKHIVPSFITMTPPYPFLQTHLCLLDHDDSTTSLPPNTSLSPSSRWLHHIPSSKHIFISFITMTSPYPFLQTHIYLLHHDDSTISLPPNTSFPSWSRWLHHIPSSKHIFPCFITMTSPYPFLQTHLSLLDHDDFTTSLPPNTSFPASSRWLRHIPSSKHIPSSLPWFITMTPLHPFLQTHLSLLHHDDSTTSLPPNTSFPGSSRWLHYIPSSKHIFPCFITMTPLHPFLQTHLSLLEHDDFTTSLPPNTSLPPFPGSSRWLHYIPSSKHIFPCFITMTPLHPFLQTHLSLLDHDDFTTSLPPNTSFPAWARWLHPTKTRSTGEMHRQFPHWGWWSLLSLHKTTSSLPHRSQDGCHSRRTGLTEWSLFTTAPSQTSCQAEKIHWLIWCLHSVYGTPTLTRGKC